MQVFLTNFASAPRWVFTRGLFYVRFFAIDGTCFAALLTTSVLVLIGWADGTGAVAGAVGAYIAAAANGRTVCRGCQTWFASLALGRIVVCFSCKPHWAIFTALSKRARATGGAFGAAGLRGEPSRAVEADCESGLVRK